MNIDDLKKLTRENECVEWKENVADINDVLKTITAFANDYANLGGGRVVCGAREGKDEYGFQKVWFAGLESKRFKEIKNKVPVLCREKISPSIVPVIEEIQVPEDDSRRILVFTVAATGHVHYYRAGGKDASTCYVRIGSNTVEARNTLLSEFVKMKGQVEAWDRRVNQRASVKDIDLIVLRNYLQRVDLWSAEKPVEDYISDATRLCAFLPPLADGSGIGSARILRPRNFALLMFAKDSLEFFDWAYTVFSVYRGPDRSEPRSESRYIGGNAVQQAEEIINALNAEAYNIFDSTSERPNMVKYPMRAIQEAVVNAVVHRDYESYHPLRVTVFSDRIEIVSPGGLPPTVDKEKFLKGKATARWRNQTLAWFFNKLNLAQALGQGIPIIIKAMRTERCPAPIFEVTSETVTCILPANPRHEPALTGESHVLREPTAVYGNDAYGNVPVSLDLKNESVTSYKNILHNLREDALDEKENNSEKEKLSKEIDRVLTALAELEQFKEEDKRTAKNSKWMVRMKNFTEKLSDTDTRIGKAVNLVENGDGYAKKLTTCYKVIAGWCGLT